MSITCDNCYKVYKNRTNLARHVCNPPKNKPAEPVKIAERAADGSLRCSACHKPFKTDRGFAAHVCKPKGKLRAPSQSSIICEYCTKPLRSAATEILHKCEPKRRFLQKDEPAVRIAFALFQKWYKLNYGAAKARTQSDFVGSRYYSLFVRLGYYSIDTRVLNPEAYVVWLAKNNIKDRDWTKDKIYDRYLADYAKIETPDRALERYINHVSKWATETDNDWVTYWDAASTNRIINDVKMGKVSPWVLLVYPPAVSFLQSLPGEIVGEIAAQIDIDYWDRKLLLFKTDVKWIQDTLP